MRILICVALVLAVVSAGCGAPPASTCSPESCSGCCNGERCELGTSAAQCGAGGLSCGVCSATQTCVVGACVGSSTGGGGGGSTAGGGGSTMDDGGSTGGGGGGSTGGGGGSTGGGGGSTGGGGGSTDGGSGTSDGGALFTGEFCELSADAGRWCWEAPGAGIQPWTGVFSVSASEAYAVAANGSIITWDGARWRSLREGDRKALRDVWASSNGDVWAVGAGGLVLRGSATGAFQVVPSGVTSDLTAVFGFSSQDVWVAGASGRLLHWEGTSFATVSSPTSNGLNDLWGATPTSIWAVGNSGTLLRYNGVGWALVTQPAGNNNTFFSAVTGTAVNDVVVAGRRAWRWDGTTFTPMLTLPTNGQVNGLTFTSSGLWAALRTDGVYYWDGTEWSKANVTPQGTLTSLSGQFPVGDEGEVLRIQGLQVSRLAPGTESLVALSGNTESQLRAWSSEGGVWARGAAGWSAVASAPPDLTTAGTTAGGVSVLSLRDGGLGTVVNGVYSPENRGFAVTSVYATNDDAYAFASGTLIKRARTSSNWTTVGASSTQGVAEASDFMTLYLSGLDSAFPPNASFSRLLPDGGISGSVSATGTFVRGVSVGSTGFVWAKPGTSGGSTDYTRFDTFGAQLSRMTMQDGLGVSLAGTPKGAVLVINTYNAGTLPVTFETFVRPPATDGGVFGPGELLPTTPLRSNALRCLGTTCWFGGERGAILRRAF